MTDTPEIAADLPGHSPATRRKTALRSIGLLAYFYVVFGILLPSVVDYGEIVDAFRAVPPQALAIVLLIGMLGWVSEGLALNAVMPLLGMRRSVQGYLITAAIGSTLTGAVKMAIGYKMFRDWGLTTQYTVLGLTVSGLASQLSKLLMPALAIWFLTVTGTFPGPGLLIGFLLLLPVAIGLVVWVWVFRSEAFAERVGAFATRASGAVARRFHRQPPGDLTPRLLDFRTSASAQLQQRAWPITLSQLLARVMGYILLLASMRAVGIPPEVLSDGEILGVYAVVMVVTLLPIAPGGAGLPEVLYISLFTRVVGDPAYDHLIAAGVMLMRGVSWFLPIPVGYLLLVLQRREVRRLHVTEPAGPAPAVDAVDPTP